MSRMSIATPCPAPSLIPLQNRRLSTTSNYSLQGEDTAEIEYTSAFRQDLGKVPPKRRHTRRPKDAAPVTIFEDVVEEQELVVQGHRAVGGSTLLAKPAKRAAVHHLERQKVEYGERERPALTAFGHARRRTSMLPRQDVTAFESDVQGQHAVIEGTLKKEPRRRTIFVPSDDTTMLTIHPGANYTDCLDDTFYFPLGPSRPTMDDPTQYSVAPPVAAVKSTKRPRASLMAAPKRLPLGHLQRYDSNPMMMDVPGENSGKENLPPGGISMESRTYKEMSEPLRISNNSTQSVKSRLFAPTVASQARHSVVPRKAVAMPGRVSLTARSDLIPQRKEAQNQSVTAKPANREPTLACHHDQIHRGLATSRDTRLSPKNAARVPAEQYQLHRDRKIAKLNRYPILNEDLSQPDLYESSWLSHQEIALSELVNQIFDDANSSRTIHVRSISLRERVVAVYHQPHVTTLHKRLQASLTCGALARPRDGDVPRLAQDLGLRRRFLSLWLDTYDHNALRAAAEVVVGRQVPRQSTSTGNSIHASERQIDPDQPRRALAGFLETFFVHAHDTKNEADDHQTSSEAAVWRKIATRSLMLLWSLDQSKSSNAIQGCLFKQKSHHKSSASVLYALTSLLIPSTGDIARTLRHLDFEVSHIQDPLDEVRYHISNIAVDLRDGVFLAHLVELLLYASLGKDSTECDATITIALPDASTLESALFDGSGQRCNWVLSQHLKMPCIGRTQKVHNVQVALSALAAHSDTLGGDCTSITAEDVVDGHREKTLSLLWALVSSFGLGRLVDWELLAEDLERTDPRLRTAAVPKQGDCGPGIATSYLQLHRQDLLQQWAAAYAQRAGVRVLNMTTSFADGKAYGAILDAFADYMPVAAPVRREHNGTAVHLEARLRSIGCSDAFTNNIVNARGSVPSRNTTVANLAFLASRLLPLARRHEAAVTIQRAFRRKYGQGTISKRTALMRLAAECAKVVKTRNQLLAAATTLQTAWRRVLDERKCKSRKDVEVFQCMAKGWIARRLLGKQSSSLSGGSVYRRMGGW